MSTDGTTEFYFNANSGIHWIRGRSNITALPGASLSPIRQRVTIAQLHDSAAPPNDVGEVLTIFTQENTGTGLAELRLRVWDTGTNMPKFSTNYTVGDEFDWMIYVNAGYWAVYYGDLGTPAYDSIEYAADGNVNVFTGDTEYYFKAGCYPQINETFVPGDTLTTVELIYLRHWHTSWPTADPVTLPVTDEFIPFFGGV
jgi:hypothetical protein